jgi:hypothetical protein
LSCQRGLQQSGSLPDVSKYISAHVTISNTSKKSSSAQKVVAEKTAKIVGTPSCFAVVFFD